MGTSMILKVVYMALQAAYRHGVRPLIREVIDDPDSEWDETVMSLLDRVFDYKTDKKDKG